jgi:hypothetical protein
MHKAACVLKCMLPTGLILIIAYLFRKYGHCYPACAGKGLQSWLGLSLSFPD